MVPVPLKCQGFVSFSAKASLNPVHRRAQRSRTSGIPEESHTAPLHTGPYNVTQRSFVVSVLVRGNSFYRYSTAGKTGKWLLVHFVDS